MLRGSILTFAILSIMITGLIGIVVTACNDPKPTELPDSIQAKIDYYRNRDIKLGLHDMSPEAKKNAKLHLHATTDDWEICY